MTIGVALLELEQERLANGSSPKLAAQVRWVSKDEGDGLGYDIGSFSDDGEAMFIEVKTTNYGRRMPFYLSSNELLFSKEAGASYQLYRLFFFSIADRRGYFTLTGSVESSCRLDATVYRATPNFS